jgi:hypothetical protein
LDNHCRLRSILAVLGVGLVMDTLLHHVPVAITVSAISQHAPLSVLAVFDVFLGCLVQLATSSARKCNPATSFALTTLIAGKKPHVVGDGMG